MYQSYWVPRTLYAALAEIRPLLENYISIAKIKVSKELKIADLSYDIFKNINDEDKMLTYLIMDEFSRPNDNDVLDYLPTQYISEYIKGNGYDAIKYNSSLYSRGRNYVVFNYDKCKADSSKLYKLNDICYDAECIDPEGQIYEGQDLYHWKLEAHKKNKEGSKLKVLKRIMYEHVGQIDGNLIEND